MVGALVMWGTGFAIIAVFHPAGANWIGPGLEPWNLPGTLLGLTIWIGAMVYETKTAERQR
jgi:hypothetical protein